MIGWSELADLGTLSSRDELLDLLRATYPAAPRARLLNWRGQLWAFAVAMVPGDLVALAATGADPGRSAPGR